MILPGLKRGVTGLAAGALLTAPLLGAFGIGWLAGLPFVPYAVFEWLIRALPGRVVVFGLDTTLSVLTGLGFDVAETSKTAEQVLAVASFFIATSIVALLFFALARPTSRRRITAYGLTLGAGLGAFSTMAALFRDVPASAAGKAGYAVLALVLWMAWGWGVSRLHRVALPGRARAATQSAGAVAPASDDARAEARADLVEAEARAISRRRFLIEMGGLAATIVVAGAGVGQVLRAEAPDIGDSPVGQTSFPNDDSPVEPAPGTRPEYTPVDDHFRVDINLDVPEIVESEWRLIVDGAVEKPLALTLDQLRDDFPRDSHFITLSCIDNVIGGPLIATTLWTGTPLRDVLAEAEPLVDARFAHIYSDDGFDEEIELDLVRDDPRVLLTYAWDGRPLPFKHGFPLRIHIPGRYGMKQPKWITRVSLLSDSVPGYWVSRGWDETAEVRATTVIDTVATKSLVTRDGTTYVPIGGIAFSGARGISRVEIQVDEQPWQSATLREPLSPMTWVVWRFDWPFSAARHYFAVRCYDGEGRLQETEKQGASPKGATGLYKEYRDF